MNTPSEKMSGLTTEIPKDSEIAQPGEVIDSSHHNQDVDVAAKFLQELDPAILRDPITPAEARKVLWKIDLIMIPMIMVTVVLAAVDKVIISNATIYGMKTDTHLVGNEYSWVGSIFYFGYLLAEYPAAFLIQRFPIAKFYAVCIMGWAVLLFCTAATSNFAGLATTRFIMGMLESVAFPISSILTVMWWTTDEQPIRLAFWFNQVSLLATANNPLPLTCAIAVLCLRRSRKLRYWAYNNKSPSMAPLVSHTRGFYRYLVHCHVHISP
jgi:ACS family allantoate permease-like MFS transporter